MSEMLNKNGGIGNPISEVLWIRIRPQPYLTPARIPHSSALWYRWKYSDCRLHQLCPKRRSKSDVNLQMIRVRYRVRESQNKHDIMLTGNTFIVLETNIL